MLDFGSPLDGIRSPLGPRRGRAFSPSTLFALAEPGVWFDPSDLTTLFTDPAGTTPVTAPGNTVGLMLDKSQGLALGAELVANGTFDDGTTTGWTSGAATSTASVVAGEMQVTAVSSSGRQVTAISTVIGVTYKVSGVGRLISAGGTGAALYQTNSSGTTITAGFVNSTTSNAQLGLVFTATATTSYISAISLGSVGTVSAFDNISVKELPGNHATQPTTASQPIYGIVPAGGRRNLLTFSEQFDVTSAWTVSGVTVSPNFSASPISDLTADKLVENTANGDHVVFNKSPGLTAPPGSYTSSVYLKAAERNFGYVQVAVNGAATRYGLVVDLSTGAVTATNTLGTPTGISYNVASYGNGWWRISVTATNTGGNIYFVSGPSSTGTPIYNASGTPLYTGDGISGILIWGAQLEQSATATPYQRVTTQYDVTEAGVASLGYLQFNGVSNAMSVATSTITPGTDKVQVFTGVRRFADTVGLIAEFSADVNSNAGSFLLLTGTSIVTGVGPGFNFTSRGAAAIASSQVGVSPTTFTPPVTAVIAAIGDISGDLSSVRGNGVTGVNGTGDQGTGNYLAYPLYIGRRGGTATPFNGQLFPLIVRFGPNLTTARISATESWVASKTPGVTL